MNDLPSKVLAVVLAVGIAGVPFYQPDQTRDLLLGGVVVPANATLAVVCLGLAVAWWSTQGRGYLWADPARLTWDDFTEPRPDKLSRRMVLGWAARWVVLAYGAAVAVVVLGWSGIACAAVLFAAVGFLALAAARVRSPGAWEWLLPLVLASAGSYAVNPLVLGGFAVLAVVGGVLLLRGESWAETAGRGELVGRYSTRMARRTSIAFLDVWGLLPPAKPLDLPRVFARRPILPRYLVAGVLARGRSVAAAGLTALVVAAAHRIFPAVPAVWWVGIGAYLAVIAFAAPVAQLNRTPGLRRWLNRSTLVVKLAATAVLAVTGALWLGSVTLLGIGFTPASLLAVVVATTAAVRSVTRAPVDFANVGMVDIGGLMVPLGLVVQVARGIDGLVLGIAFLAGGLFPITVALCVLAVLA
ncbi:hypothetical protein [Actinokineospora inagensis]|uniref:hypothetical protein n=1 Tax=Actinokineospora inagensis TaxID=103730 RepID=UPI000685370F|nr:hypothetical protein [Actinokineospora inagensis]